MDQSLLGSVSVPHCCSLKKVKSWLPILSWLPQYNLKWLQMDVLAGLTVGMTVIPQALAYANVAGLPVQFGLYSAFMGGFIYMFLGTSKDVTLGPTAIMSLLCFSVVGGEPHRAVLLSLLCGLIQATMGLLRLGFLLDFISYPVLKGFTCAAAVTIGFGQVKNILGLRGIPTEFVLEVYYTFAKLPEARVGDVVLGLLCLILLFSLTLMKMTLPSEDAPTSVRVARKFIWAVATMRNALVVVGATVVAFSWEAYGHHIFTITGETTEGLPPFKPPPTSDITANGTNVTFGEIVKDFGGGLAVIPFMGLLESIAIAKAFGSQNGYRIVANQELLAIGLTNIMGSFVSAYPVTGSFGRTAVNSQTGVCTPAGGIVTSSVVLLSLAFLMPAFYYIPKASLAAVIICAVAPMVDYRVVKKMWNIYKLDLLPFGVTFLVCFWEVQYGIIAGMAMSGALLLYNSARPKIKDSEISDRRARGYADNIQCEDSLMFEEEMVQLLDHDTLVLELRSGLSFPATEHLSHFIHKNALQACPARSVVLDCHHVSVIDYSVVNELADLLRQFRAQGVRLVFARLEPSIFKVLLAADLENLRHKDSVEEALQESVNLHSD